MQGETNRLFYKLGKVLLPFICLAVCAALFGKLDLFYRFQGCVFKEMTGVYCPGCGGTRAVIELLRLHPVKSFCYHPAVLYFAAVYAVFMIKMFLLKHFQIGIEHEGRLLIFIYIGIGIIFVQWIVKLVCQLVFHITWL
mgnify:CR=1 FL=1